MSPPIEPRVGSIRAASGDNQGPGLSKSPETALAGCTRYILLRPRMC